MKHFTLLILAAFALSSCRTVAPCDLAPSVEGWKPVKVVPAALSKLSGHAGPWHIDSKGQYVACARRGNDLCSGNYTVYAAFKDTFERVDLIVCLAARAA